MRASYQGNFKVVATLLAYGADMNIIQKVLSLSLLDIVVVHIQPLQYITYRMERQH
jgi:hypothetical protein